jgi:hypothetical protein
MISSGLAFVASHLSISGELPVQIIAQHSFRPATDTEIEQIKQVLDTSVPRDTYSWVPYESVVKAEHRGDNSTTFHHDPLPRDQWKYWVIAFDGQNTKLHEIELVAQLLPCAFDIAFVLFYELPGQTGKLNGRQIMPVHVIERYGGRGCPKFCVNGQMAGNCRTSRKMNHDRQQRIDRPAARWL